jgi:hypothetical protein
MVVAGGAAVSEGEGGRTWVRRCIYAVQWRIGRGGSERCAGERR